MARPVVIQVGGQPQGIVTPLGTGYRFVAVRIEVFSLDGEIFPSPVAAQKAAQRAIRSYRSSSKGDAA